MDMCNKIRIHDLMLHSGLHITSDASEDIFLDDYRIGLRLTRQMNVLESASFTPEGELINRKEFLLSGDRFDVEPSKLYLFQTRERFSIPRSMFGFIFTRSKYARIGFEVAGSSTFIAPGFGLDEPTSLILEVKPAARISGLPIEEAYGFVILFENNHVITQNRRQYHDRFPFSAEFHHDAHRSE